MLTAMTEAPNGRLVIAMLAFSVAAAAQSSPQETANAPAQDGTLAPAERVQTPQPQPYQAQPPQAQPIAPAPAQPTPPAQPTYPSNYASNYGSPQPNAAPAATGGTRDANNPNNQSGDYRNNEPPKVSDEESKFEMPAWSVRIDPFNWLLAGRLGLELESQIWKFISVELVPQFVVNDQPPYLNLNLIGVPNTLRQKSAGLGALAGTSIGVGFWLNGKPMEGYVLRAEITNYSIDYDSAIDHVNYVERELQVLIGQHSKWGPFTIAGTFGIGSMLNKHERCFKSAFDVGSAQTSGCPNGKQMLLAVATDSTTGQLGVLNLNGWLYPIDLVMRISLGVAF